MRKHFFLFLKSCYVNKYKKKCSKNILIIYITYVPKQENLQIVHKKTLQKKGYTQYYPHYPQELLTLVEVIHNGKTW